MFLQEALKNLSQAAQNPYAFVAYLAVIIAWGIISWRVKRNKNLLKQTKKMSEEGRKELILAEMGRSVPPRLSADEWLKSQSRRYFFYAFLALSIVSQK